MLVAISLHIVRSRYVDLCISKRRNTKIDKGIFFQDELWHISKVGKSYCWDVSPTRILSFTLALETAILFQNQHPLSTHEHTVNLRTAFTSHSTFLLYQYQYHWWWWWYLRASICAIVVTSSSLLAPLATLLSKMIVEQANKDKETVLQTWLAIIYQRD